MDVTELKTKIIKAGFTAVEELIKVAEEPIITEENVSFDDMGLEDKAKLENLAADKLKNAAQAKKLAIFDAFEILGRITAEEELMNLGDVDKKRGGFAEGRSK